MAAKDRGLMPKPDRLGIALIMEVYHLLAPYKLLMLLLAEPVVVAAYGTNTKLVRVVPVKLQLLVEQVVVGGHGLRILLVAAVVAVVLTTTTGVAVAAPEVLTAAVVMMVCQGITG